MGLKVTIERGKSPMAIKFQGHKFDVLKADSKIKEMLFKIKSESMEHGKIIILFFKINMILIFEYLITDIVILDCP